MTILNYLIKGDRETVYCKLIAQLAIYDSDKYVHLEKGSGDSLEAQAVAKDLIFMAFNDLHSNNGGFVNLNQEQQIIIIGFFDDTLT